MPAAPSTLADLDALLPFGAEAHHQRVTFIEPSDDLDWHEPFWHMTLQREEQSNDRGELDTVDVDFEHLRQIVGAIAPEPKAMIFHIGRCGSTLVARMVGHDATTLVLREARPIGALHRATGGSDLVPTFTIEQAFKDVLVAFDRFAAARGRRVIVKHSSWESFAMTRMAELLPDVPFVFVCRNPIEMVESSLDGHPAWAPRLHEPRALLQRWVPWLDRQQPPFTAATIYASVWASGVKAALDLDPQRVLIVDHAELTASPRSTVERLRRFLELDLPVDKALTELDRYSKSGDDSTAFEPDGRHAHPSLSIATRHHVLDVVQDLPDRLHERIAAQD